MIVYLIEPSLMKTAEITEIDKPNNMENTLSRVNGFFIFYKIFNLKNRPPEGHLVSVAAFGTEITSTPVMLINDKTIIFYFDFFHSNCPKDK